MALQERNTSHVWNPCGNVSSELLGQFPKSHLQRIICKQWARERMRGSLFCPAAALGFWEREPVETCSSFVWGVDPQKGRKCTNDLDQRSLTKRKMAGGGGGRGQRWTCCNNYLILAPNINSGKALVHGQQHKKQENGQTLFSVVYLRWYQNVKPQKKRHTANSLKTISMFASH